MAACRRRVVSPQGKRLTMICASLHSFKSCSLCIASAQGGDSACGAEGGGLPLQAMLIKSALRDWLFVSYGMISILVISHLRWHSPLWCLTSPKGDAFPRPSGRLLRFYTNWRRRRRTSPAQRYYITPEGGSPEPVREASAGPGQNPWRPGPKARRRHQPSRP